MQDFSNVDKMPQRERTINLVHSRTGLPKTEIKKIFESESIKGKTDKDIVKYFDEMSEIKMSPSSDMLLKTLDELLGEIKTPMTNKNEQFFMLLSNFFTDSHLEKRDNLDSVNLLAMINKLVAIKNPEIAKEIINVTGHDLVGLTADNAKETLPNLTETLSVQTTGETVELFENLRVILQKNNKRWGAINQLNNTYQHIMDYLAKEVQDIQTKQEIVSFNSQAAYPILKNLMSNNPGTEYQHINFVKLHVADIQTMALDLLLLIDYRLRRDEQILKYISPKKIEDLSTISDSLFLKLSSSLQSSTVLEKTFLEKFKSNEFTGTYNLTKRFSSQIDYNKFPNLENMEMYNIDAMLNLLNSMKTEFNLSFRQLFSAYITTAKHFADNYYKKRVEMLKVYNGNTNFVY